MYTTNYVISYKGSKKYQQQQYDFLIIIFIELTLQTISVCSTNNAIIQLQNMLHESNVQRLLNSCRDVLLYLLSQVILIYIALLTMQIVSKQLYRDKLYRDCPSPSAAIELERSFTSIIQNFAFCFSQKKVNHTCLEPHGCFHYPDDFPSLSKSQLTDFPH